MIKAYTKKTIKIKEQNNLFSKNIEKVEKGNWLVCIEQEGKMTKVRQNIINLILQEAIKNDKMYVKITYNGAEEQKYDRFKIEITPILSECGIKVEF